MLKMTYHHTIVNINAHIIQNVPAFKCMNVPDRHPERKPLISYKILPTIIFVMKRNKCFDSPL